LFEKTFLNKRFLLEKGCVTKKEGITLMPNTSILGKNTKTST
jgi:hypothetical protein